MMSMWSQSAPNPTILSASDARFAKSDDSIDGAIFAFTAIAYSLSLSLSLSPSLSGHNRCRKREAWLVEEARLRKVGVGEWKRGANL